MAAVPAKVQIDPGVIPTRGQSGGTSLLSSHTFGDVPHVSNAVYTSAATLNG
jgi:hypothetical protein